jgi:orotate phosphoribosyltransferase
LQSQFGVPVVSIATLDDVMAFVRDRAELAPHVERIEAYRREYGVE